MDNLTDNLGGIRTPSFKQYFEYMRLVKGTDTALADNWLLLEFYGKTIDELMYSEYTTLMRDFRRPTAELGNIEFPMEFRGKLFEFHDKPATFFQKIQQEFNKNQANGLRLAAYTFYTVNGVPIKECENDLDYYDADILIKHHMKFF